MTTWFPQLLYMVGLSGAAWVLFTGGLPVDSPDAFLIVALVGLSMRIRGLETEVRR